MNENLVDQMTLAERLKQLPPGRGLAVSERIGHGKQEIAFCLRDSTERIKSLGASPKIGIRASILEQSLPIDPPLTVALAPIVLVIGPPSIDSIFEISVDLFDPQSSGVFETLARQLKLSILLYGDDLTRVRTLSVPNGLQKFAVTVVDRKKGSPQWTRENFAMAEEAISEQFVDTLALWVRLGSPN